MTELVIPVYLNQRLVFDLLAMLDGGFSLVERVSSSSSESSERTRRYGAEFGLSKALLGIFKIGVSGEGAKGDSASQGTSSDRENYQTPASLFFNLRQQMIEKKLVVRVDADSQIEHHAFIEFTAYLTRNPLIASLDAMASMMEFAIVFSDKAAGKDARKEKQNNEQTKKQMEFFSSKLRAGETVDIIGSEAETKHKIVITLEEEYLNDPSMADLVDGRFTVLGKVIRVQNDKNKAGISLLRKTALAVMDEAMLNQVLEGFRGAEGFNLPEPEWEVKPPVVQVIPISIFA